MKVEGCDVERDDEDKVDVEWKNDCDEESENEDEGDGWGGKERGM